MSMPGFPPEPFQVACNRCGTEGRTFDFQHPGRAVECLCCPVAHDHDAAANACPREHAGGCGKGVPGCAVCRPVTVTGRAYLRMFDLAEVLDSMADDSPAAETLPSPAST